MQANRVQFATLGRNSRLGQRKCRFYNEVLLNSVSSSSEMDEGTGPASLPLCHSAHHMLWRKERGPASEPINCQSQGIHGASIARSSQFIRADISRTVQQEMQVPLAHPPGSSSGFFALHPLSLLLLYRIESNLQVAVSCTSPMMNTHESLFLSYSDILQDGYHRDNPIMYQFFFTISRSGWTLRIKEACVSMSVCVCGLQSHLKGSIYYLGPWKN